MPAPWDPDFDFYMTQIEDKPASIVLDIAAGPHVPLASHPVLLTIRVPMRRPRPDGLRDGAELDALADIEDRFTEALEANVDALYAGRTVHDGDTTLYYYVPLAHRARLDELPVITGDPGDYEPEWSIEEDAGWGLYQELLAPGPYELQGIWNRRLVAQFEQNGDRLDEAREVDHVARFPSKEQAAQAAIALDAAGFRIDPVTAPADELGWELSFHRDDALADDGPDEFVAEILDIILELDGDYGGWGAVNVMPEMN